MLVSVEYLFTVYFYWLRLAFAPLSVPNINEPIWYGNSFVFFFPVFILFQKYFVQHARSFNRCVGHDIWCAPKWWQKSGSGEMLIHVLLPSTWHARFSHNVRSNNIIFRHLRLSNVCLKIFCNWSVSLLMGVICIAMSYFGCMFPPWELHELMQIRNKWMNKIKCFYCFDEMSIAIALLRPRQNRVDRSQRKWWINLNWFYIAYNHPGNAEKCLAMGS